MFSFSVSKRYKVLLILLVQLISSISMAEAGEVKIFGYVSLAIPRPAQVLRKIDNLAPPSESTMALFNRAMVSRNADTEFEKMHAVNAWINEKIDFTEDSDDQWKNANQTLAAAKGDCEDHAITKMQLLRRAGFDDNQLLLVMTKDLVLRQHHIVLVVEMGGEYYVLDNVTDNLLPHTHFKSVLFPVYAVTSKKSWTFGIQKTQDSE